MATKFNEQTIQKLEQSISMGATYELACKYAGITYQTFRNWILKGEEAKSGKYKEFVERINGAEGRAAIGWLAKIEKAASDGSWQAAAWKLERRYPDSYGRTRVDHDVTSGGETIETRVIAALPDDQISRILKLSDPKRETDE